MKRIEVFGVKIDDVSCEEAVERALTQNGEPCWVVTPNAVMLDACRRNASEARLLNRAKLSLADGSGVLLAANRKGTPLKARVAGIEFGEALLARAEQEGLRVFLLGGADGVAEGASECLRARFPELCVCGSFWGYFDKEGEEDRRVTALIRESCPDILFVCFGFPLQEKWIWAHLSQLSDLRVIAGLGGALDVWAGRVRRAPRLISRIGMEWAWRMLLEPKRVKNLPAIVRLALCRRADF